jgi:hypothetical protein
MLSDLQGKNKSEEPVVAGSPAGESPAPATNLNMTLEQWLVRPVYKVHKQTWELFQKLEQENQVPSCAATYFRLLGDFRQTDLYRRNLVHLARNIVAIHLRNTRAKRP